MSVMVVFINTPNRVNWMTLNVKEWIVEKNSLNIDAYFKDDNPINTSWLVRAFSLICHK